MGHEKSTKDDVKITKNNILLDTDSSIINYFRLRAIEELNQRREEEKSSAKKDKTKSK